MNTECPSCGWTKDLPEKFHGRKVRCPKCETVFRVGESSMESGHGGLMQKAWFLPTVSVTLLLLLLGGFLLYLGHTSPSQDARSRTTEEGTASTTDGRMADNAGADTASAENTSAQTISGGETSGDGELADAYGSRFFSPENGPQLPEAFDPFEPPALESPPDGAPGISQWNRTAGPDQHVILAGYNFKTEGDPNGEQTEFRLFAQTARGQVETTGDIVGLYPYQAVVHIPDKIPEGSMITVQPVNAAGAGEPVALNQTEVWYTLPRKAEPGGPLSVYGRNLMNAGAAEGRSWLLLKSRDGEEMVLLETEQANSYKADFKVPEDLATGDYEVWAHNGHGGQLGWSPQHARLGGKRPPRFLTIEEPRKWDGPKLDVTEFGADGGDEEDDTEAFKKALEEANNEKNSTIYIPAGTYFLSKPLKPIAGPDKSGVRIMGDGMKKTFIKGNPEADLKNMMHITGGGVVVRDLILDFNLLGEEEKYYRDFERPEHVREHYVWLEKRQKIRNKRESWKKKNKGESVPEDLKDPEKPDMPQVEENRERVAGGGGAGGRKLITKDTWEKGLSFINCVLDAERHKIQIDKGVKDALFDNCDIVAREVILGSPAFTRIQNCNFYLRADAGMALYIFGGWNISVHNNTAQDYMPNTYDTGMGRFLSVSAYGNRHENVYIGGNRTKDLTVQPTHHNQNSGEQFMWEFTPMTATMSPTEVTEDTLTFKKKPGTKKNKGLPWYHDAVITHGKGLGQYRQVSGFDKETNTVEVSPPWDIPPDTNSTVQIGTPIQRVVVHGNYLDGKPRAYLNESHIASIGVLSFGASIELTVENNTFHETRAAAATSQQPYLFARFANNKVEKVRRGFGITKGTGAVTVGNDMHHMLEHAFMVSANKEEKGDRNMLTVIENNHVEDTPIGVKIGGRSGTKRWHDLDLWLSKNRFLRGAIEGEQSIGVLSPGGEEILHGLEDNTFEGFQDTFRKSAK